MKIKKIKKNRGFVLLFAIMLSSIILAISLGVMNVSLKEIKFSTSAEDTNEAFFAADTGAECALYNDKSTSNSFIDPAIDPPTGSGVVNCLGDQNIGLRKLRTSNPVEWQFILTRLGNEKQGCAIVNVIKNFNDPVSTKTTIISKGYNNGGDSGGCNQGSNTVERQLEVNY